MLEAINGFLVAVMDVVFGWLLRLPRDVAVLIVSVVTAALIIGVRVFSTDQELLRRCRDDKIRLKRLMAEAKAKGDKEALARYRLTVGMVGTKSLAAEWKPLLVSLVPIVFVAVWCFARIAYLPIQPDTPFVVRVYVPATRVGDIAHIVPQEGVRAETGWVQRFREQVMKGKDGKDEVVGGIADWKLSCAGRPQPYRLQVRYHGQTYEKEVIVDGLRTADPLVIFPGKEVEGIEVMMVPYRLFGVVPGLGFLQPWIVAYLLMVVPFSFLIKAIFRIL